MSESERGSALPFIVLFVVLAATLVAAELKLGQILVSCASAQNGADAVALAAATGGEPVAHRVADANGVTVEVLRVESGRSTARVRAGTLRASAKAERSSLARAPALRAALATAEAVLTASIPILAEGTDWVQTDGGTSAKLDGRSDVTGLCPAGVNKWAVCR